MKEIGSKERDHLMLFAQSDSHLRSFMPRRSSLVPDLVTRLLLESGVVISDSQFLSSAEIASDLRSTDRGLIWHGLRKGLIIPAFRAKGVGSFEQNRLQGVLPTTSIGVRDDSLEIAKRIDEAIERGPAKKITWPDGIGISFGKLMDEQFRRETVDSDSWGDKERKLWQQSRDLRNKYLDMGWQREPDPEVTGLRRSTIFVAMAEDLRFGGDPLDTAGIVRSVGRGQRAALRATLLWIDELYNYNQATRFRVRSSFPVSSGPGSLMTPGMLLKEPGRVPDPDDTKTYSHSVRWPGVKVLLGMPPDTLMGLRSGDYGEEYIYRLQDFRKPEKADKADKWDSLTRAMDAYADKICKEAGSEVRSALDVKHLLARNGMTIGIAVGGLTAGLAVIGTAGIAGVVSVIAGGLASVYLPVSEIVRDRRASAEVQLPVTSGKRGNLQIDLPAK
jgi:hypothetical protein